HHSPGRSAAEWFEESHRQRINKVGVDAHECKQAAEALDDIIQCARGPKYADAHQHSHQVGDDLNRCYESVLGTLDKCLKEFDLSHQAKHKEAHDDAYYDQAADQA